MLRLELNPPGAAAEMLEGLNRSFPGWGGPAAYRWYFGGRSGARADLLILRDRRGIAAATGVNYRRVVLGADGASVVGGILTSSWTAPEQRGRGLFSRLIEESAHRVRDREGALLLAFVTEDNPSCRALSRAGCVLYPSWYLFSTASTPRSRAVTGWTEVAPGTATVESVRNEARLSRRGYLHFRYDRARDWVSQFLLRPHPVEVVGFDGHARALVETAPGAGDAPPSDRVQLLLPRQDPEPVLSALLARAQAKGRQLFLYTTSTPLVTAARGLGLEVKPGRVAVRPTDGDRWPPALRSAGMADRWLLCSGDRM